MRIVFLGTPEFAVPTLRRLQAEVVGVVCQPDRPAGRGRGVRAPAVKVAAQQMGLRVYQPEKMRGAEALAWLQEQKAEALVVVAYGQLLPAAVFSRPRWGAINAHASLLPAYRGAAPIQWALARGEGATGVTTMQINAGLDTGDILLQRALKIGREETAPELSRRLAELAGELMEETLRGLEAGGVQARPQPGGETQAPPLKREDGRVDWLWTAEQIYNRWRGFQPWPGIHARFHERQLGIVRCRPVPGVEGEPGALVVRDGILIVACGEAALELQEVRAEGRQTVTGAEFARGARIGSRLDPLARLQ